MELLKTIYKNTKKINEMTLNSHDAKDELIRLLLQKIKKRYKITIVTDRINNTIEANLYFTHTLSNSNLDNYKYHYAFTNICNSLKNEL